MKKKLLLMMLVIVASAQAWGYRITDNYTIEVKFKINAIGAGIMFANYNGFNGDFYMWQFNVGQDGTRSLFRPHHWNPAALIEEKGTGDITLNTVDWFVTKIEVTNGNHADTYLRRADDVVDVLIDSRDGDFRFGMIGFRQDHDGNINESASYDYVKITDEAEKVLYFDDFDAPVSWQNDPIVENGCLTAEGRDLSERRYRPNNMFANAVDMHYAVDADVQIESGYVSFVFGLGDNGSNYMWQISPNLHNDGGVAIYYHLDNGNESWKAHAGGANFPVFTAEDFKTPRHVRIEVDANVVKTYVDDLLVDNFVQCDMTDLERLNDGGIGIRADGGNNMQHKGTIDNVKLTKFDAEGNVLSVEVYDNFNNDVSRYFDVNSNAFVSVADGKFVFDVPAGGGNSFRLLQSTTALNPLFIGEEESNDELPSLPATEVTLSRTFKANMWNTLCLPFSLTAAQVETLLGTGAKVAALKSFDADNEVLQFATADAVEALKPYLVYPTQDVTAPVNFTVDVTEGVELVDAVGDYKFVGNISPLTFVGGADTFLFVAEGNKLVHPSVTGDLKALRAYFEVPSGATAKFAVDGEETAVEGISAQIVAAPAYNLAGQRVGAGYKGLVIENGKKMVK